jgi:murein DD-endopeptidase MepM/ murein hydrolase activator NlpD
VVARAGDIVSAGALIGYVGNSGNTDEPHLHIHLQRQASAPSPLSGQPLHITFGSRFPLRNMIFD